MVSAQLYACPIDPRGILVDMVTLVGTEPQRREKKRNTKQRNKQETVSNVSNRDLDLVPNIKSPFY